MTSESEEGLFSDRMRRIAHAASPTIGPEELIRFLRQPNPMLDGRCPWDVIIDCEEKDFEQLEEMVRSEARQRQIARKSSLE